MIRATIVHLSKSRSPWVFSNISRTLDLFPQIPLVFISDQNSHLKKAAKLGAETYLYVPSHDTNLLFSNLNHNATFRHDFWRTSIERLVAIHQYQSRVSQERLLHIESDVMLMPNFPWEKVEKLDKLTWLSSNSIHDCAALFYSPSANSIEWLIGQLQSEIYISSKSTDMTILFSVRKKNPGMINVFPSTSIEVADDLLRSDRQRYLVNTKLTSYFGGIFDPGNMGMWLAGQNPRNQGGWIIRYEQYFTQDNIFDADSFSLLDDSLFVGRQKREEVFMLHVHSKNRYLLSRRWYPELERLVEESNASSKKRKFSVSGFLGSQYDIFISVNRNIFTFLAICLNLVQIIFVIKSTIRKLLRNSPKI